MKKSHIIIYITAVITVFISLLICVFLLINEGVRGMEFPKFSIDFNKDNDVKVKNIIEDKEGVDLKISSDVETTTDENNVFKVETDLSSFLDEEDLEIRFYPVKNKDGSFSYVDENGNVVSKETYDNAEVFNEGLAAVSKDGKFGFIDNNFNVVIPYQYNYILEDGFINGLTTVVLNSEENAVINKKNEIIISGRFDYCYLNYPGVIIVHTGKKVKNFNLKGEEIKLPRGYEFINGFVNGIAQIANSNYKTKFINENGEVFGVEKATEITSFENGIAEIFKKENEKSFYINRELKPIYLKDRYYGMDYYSINDNVLIVFDSEDYEKPFKYIDLQGNILFDSEHITSNGFIGDSAFVNTDKGTGVMDNEGKIIKEFKGNVIDRLTEKLFLSEDNGVFIIVDVDENIIIKEKYDGVYKDGNVINAFIDNENELIYDLYNADGERINEDALSIEYYYNVDEKIVFIKEKNKEYYYNVETKKIIPTNYF